MKESTVKRSDYAKSFQDLVVYKRAYNISLVIHKTTLNFPKMEHYAIGDQIRRASKSICANLGEGYVKKGYSLPEFKRFLSMAVGSAGEMLVWLQYCYDLGYIPRNLYEEWINEYDAIIKMLQKLRQNAKATPIS